MFFHCGHWETVRHIWDSVAEIDLRQVYPIIGPGQLLKDIQTVNGGTQPVSHQGNTHVRRLTHHGLGILTVPRTPACAQQATLVAHKL